MPFGFGRKSASPDVARIRDSSREKFVKKIPSLTEINALQCDFLSCSDQNLPRCNSSRFPLDTNGPSLSSFRVGISSSISSPNLSESPYLKKRNIRKSEPKSGPNLCPTCSIPYNDENECRVPRILPCLHTLCTGCLQGCIWNWRMRVIKCCIKA